MGSVLAASGAGPLASGIGSAVGISGNLGVTDRVRHEQGPDGSFKSHTETLHGFAGGVDVAGRRLVVADILLGSCVCRDAVLLRILRSFACSLAF